MSKKLTEKGFIERAKKVHGDKYDYSKVEYVNTDTKVCIVCAKHGDFWQTPHNHLKGQNCPKCSHRSIKYGISEFIKEARKVHGDKYDYSKVDYKGNKIKICIICPRHGEFWIRPNNHLNKQGCPKCGLESISKKLAFTTEQFIIDARKIHKDKYDYSKVNYINNHTKVCIICPKHGEFWQTPANHLMNHGCPYCNSSLLEKKVYDFLNKDSINVIQQKRFKWLGLKSIDFYLPDYNSAIECQGIQHFLPSKNGKSFFNHKKVEKIKKNDLQKKKLCEEHGIKIFYYSNLGIKYPYKVYEDLDELLKEIKEHSYFETMKEVLCEVKT